MFSFIRYAEVYQLYEFEHKRIAPAPSANSSVGTVNLDSESSMSAESNSFHSREYPNDSFVGIHFYCVNCTGPYNTAADVHT